MVHQKDVVLLLYVLSIDYCICLLLNRIYDYLYFLVLPHNYSVKCLFKDRFFSSVDNDNFFKTSYQKNKFCYHELYNFFESYKAQKNEQLMSFSYIYFVGQVLPQNICAREYVNTKHLGQPPTGK